MVVPVKRAQAAIEYLSTYGWAILIMLVAVVLLLWLGIINPKTPLQSSCIFPSDFVCRGYVLHTDGSYALDVGQATGHPINVTKVKCTSETSPTLGDGDTLEKLPYGTREQDGRLVFSGGGGGEEPGELTTNPVTIANGDHALVVNFTKQCYDADGAEITDQRAGNMYKGRIFIEYLELDTGFTHQIVGDVSLKYENVSVD